MREAEGTNKWKDILCSWIARQACRQESRMVVAGHRKRGMGEKDGEITIS